MNVSCSTIAETITLSQSRASLTSTSTINENHNETTTTATKSTADNTKMEPQPDKSTPSNLCVLCLKEEKRLACVPCGHVATCVSCYHTLRSCPICQREIEAFIRIYL
jgi:hypothetical protein